MKFIKDNIFLKPFLHFNLAKIHLTGINIASGYIKEYTYIKDKILLKINYRRVFMKITVENMNIEENEIVLRCKSIDDEMLHILSFLKSRSQKLCAFKNRDELILLSPDAVYYCESVDQKVFLYCENNLYETALNLAELENNYSSVGFLRISKSMIVNLYKIKRLKSYTSGRIEVVMKNDEKIIVSRHYAPILRQKLEI